MRKGLLIAGVCVLALFAACKSTPQIQSSQYETAEYVFDRTDSETGVKYNLHSGYVFVREDGYALLGHAVDGSLGLFVLDNSGTFTMKRVISSAKLVDVTMSENGILLATADPLEIFPTAAQLTYLNPDFSVKWQRDIQGMVCPYSLKIWESSVTFLTQPEAQLEEEYTLWSLSAIDGELQYSGEPGDYQAVLTDFNSSGHRWGAELPRNASIDEIDFTMKLYDRNFSIYKSGAISLPRHSDAIFKNGADDSLLVITNIGVFVYDGNEVTKTLSVPELERLEKTAEVITSEVSEELNCIATVSGDEGARNLVLLRYAEDYSAYTLEYYEVPEQRGHVPYIHIDNDGVRCIAVFDNVVTVMRAGNG